MKDKKILAYIVGILFGIVFSIPLVALYSFFNLFWGYLAILIVFGIILGYKVVKKEIYNTKSVRTYLLLASLFVVLLDVLVFMPILVQFVRQGKVTISFFAELYSTKSVVIAFLIDLIPALFMIIVPALLLPRDFKKGKDIPSEGEEFINQVEEAFKKHNAYTKETAIDAKIIKSELKNIKMNNFMKFWYIDFLKNIRIKSHKGKWYFKKKNKSFSFGLVLSVLVLIVFAFIWNICFNIVGSDMRDNLLENVKEEVKSKTKNTEYEISDKIKITMPECMTFLEKDFDNKDGFDMYYYQYVSSNVAKSDLEAIQIYYLDNYNINDYYLDYSNFENQIYNNLSQYIITEKDSIDLNGNTGFYLKFDKMDETRIAIGYFIPVNNGLIQVYTYLNKENYSDESKVLSDNIVKSIQFN